MIHMFWLTLAVAAASPDAPVQSKNGEFIFRQYPPRAKAAGEQGTVKFQVEVNAKGIVLSCKVTRSSGFRRLDDETCEMIVDHATFTPTLDSGGKEREAVHDGLVNWKLDDGSVAPPKVSEANLPDKIICKRITKTGSLVAHSRQCMTRRQWEFQAQEARDAVGEIQRRDHAQRN